MEEEEKAEVEEIVEEEEQEEHPDLLACRVRGHVGLTPMWPVIRRYSTWSRDIPLNSYLLPATTTAAATTAEAAEVAAMDIHDCVYVCIGDGGGPARSSSIRTRATVAEVTGWRFPFPRGTRRILRYAVKRTRNVSPFRQRTDRQRTAVLLLFVSNPTRRHRRLRTVLPVLLQTEKSRDTAAGHSERLFHR